MSFIFPLSQRAPSMPLQFRHAQQLTLLLLYQVSRLFPLHGMFSLLFCQANLYSCFKMQFKVCLLSATLRVLGTIRHILIAFVHVLMYMELHVSESWTSLSIH